MDPITLSITAAVAGGLTTKAIDKISDLGSKWLSERYRDHEQNVKNQAKKTVKNF